jgi:hypothetical protein
MESSKGWSSSASILLEGGVSLMLISWLSAIGNWKDESMATVEGLKCKKLWLGGRQGV